jgi:hypothetical protein
MTMADEEAGPQGPMVFKRETVVGGAEASPKAAGWYPTRTSPTDQNYWDGQNWTARRRWSGQGWMVSGDAPPEAYADAGHATAGQRLSANPYAPMAAPTKSKGTGFTFNLGVLLLWVCGIGLMYGSIGSWVHVTGGAGIANVHVSINGIDPAISSLISVNGWVTFIAGILIVIFACFQMTSEEVMLDVFTTIVAALAAVFAIYDMFRIVQKINEVPTSGAANVSVGWGLICVLGAAVLATLVTLLKLIQR